MYTPAAEGGGSVQVFMLNYCLGINTANFFSFYSLKIILYKKSVHLLLFLHINALRD